MMSKYDIIWIFKNLLGLGGGMVTGIEPAGYWIYSIIMLSY